MLFEQNFKITLRFMQTFHHGCENFKKTYLMFWEVKRNSSLYQSVLSDKHPNFLTLFYKFKCPVSINMIR